MVVVVVPDDELLDESSFLEQEMMVVAEKQEIRNFYKNFFILFLNTKSKKLLRIYFAQICNMNWLILQEEW